MEGRGHQGIRQELTSMQLRFMAKSGSSSVSLVAFSSSFANATMAPGEKGNGEAVADRCSL